MHTTLKHRLRRIKAAQVVLIMPSLAKTTQLGRHSKQTIKSLKIRLKTPININRRISSSKNLNSNSSNHSNAVRDSRARRASKIDCTSIWLTCWSTFTMGREQRSIVTTTLMSSQYSMSKKGFKRSKEMYRLRSQSIHFKFSSKARLRT